MTHALRLAMVGLATVIASPALARTQTPVTVQGLAFDSLRGAPLRNALVMIVGARASARTDARGRFHFDSVAPGARTFIVQHGSLDSAGLPGLSRRLVLADEEEQVQLAVPSFPTLWRAVCGGEPPRDSGFVYGTIRSVVDGDPVTGAAVELGWVVTTYDRMRGLRQRRVWGETTTDSTGGYAVCGVPTSHWLQLIAAARDGSGGVDIPPGDLRVQRRDLLIGPTFEQDSSSRGSILGILTDADGVPYSEARIVLDDSTEVRSGGDGRFAFRGVQAGTRQVEIMSIGIAPIVLSVDVLPRDSVFITQQLRRVTTLDVIRVTASRRGRMIVEGIEERRVRSLGYSMDMTELQAHASFSTVLNDFPGVRVQQNKGDYHVFIPDGRGGLCTPEIWIDGARMALASLQLVRPRDVMAVEYFPRAGLIPFEFRRNEQLMHCGAVLVWTNWALSR